MEMQGLCPSTTLRVTVFFVESFASRLRSKLIVLSGDEATMD